VADSLAKICKHIVSLKVSRSPIRGPLPISPEERRLIARIRLLQRRKGRRDPTRIRGAKVNALTRRIEKMKREGQYGPKFERLIEELRLLLREQGRARSYGPLMPGRGAKRGRDPENPHKGEVFETRSGNRWEVEEVSDKRVKVRRKGHRAEGPFTWAKSTLRGMRSVTGRKAITHDEGPPEPPEKRFLPEKPAKGEGFFSFLGDPGGKKKRKGSKKKSSKTLTRKRKRKRKPAPRSLASRGGKKRGSWKPVRGGKAWKGKKSGFKSAANRFIHKHGGVGCPHSTSVQSLVFEKRHFTVASAKSWAKNHGYVYSKVDVTTNSIRLRQHSPSVYRPVGSTYFKRGLLAVIGCRGR
jgi:hypothetical protein